MQAATREFVHRRANHRCEYCLLSQEHGEVTHHVEHIVARMQAVPTTSKIWHSLVIACHLHKGPNLSGIDPLSQVVVPLFHPRRDRWTEHFAFQGIRV